MKKQFWTLSLTLTLILSGCGFAGTHQEEAPLEPLSAAAWPTPQPPLAQPSPTSFPKSSLDDLPANEEFQSEAVAAEPAEDLSSDSSLAEVSSQTNSLLSELSPVASGFVTAGSAIVRQGPGESYPANETLEQGAQAAILGRDESGNWLYVITTSLSPGWLPAGTLRVIGDVSAAPILPPNPLAAFAPAASAASNQPGVSAAGGQTIAVNELTPVALAQVITDGVNVRQRPGGNYARLATLAQGQVVDVLALNRDYEWALVKITSSQAGWVSIDFLDISGNLSAAPIVRTLEPTSTDEVAPVVIVSGPSAQSSRRQPAAPQPAPVAYQQPTASLAFADLTPVAMAHIAQNEVEIRPGPGTAYAAIDKLTDGPEEISILALDQSQQWALVEPAHSRIGWVAVDELRLEGDLEDAPQVFTAWVESNAVDIRQGPGIFYDAIGPLSINSLVSVLGLNEGRNWALIKPVPGGGIGWVSTRYLNPGGRWTDVPTAPELPGPAENSADTLPTGPAFTPARPASESKIVFQRASGGDIMVINPDGSGLRRLTAGIDPVLSPDGQQVAFTRWQGETGSLWTIGTDGSNERQILGFIKQAKGPDWSPDGSQIVLNFQHQGRVQPKDVCTDLTQSNPGKPPRNAYDFDVKLDNDGEPELCWTLPSDPHWSLRVVNVADGSYEDLDGGTYAFRPAWDPSQPWRIVSDGGRGLLAVDVNRDDFHQPLSNQANDGAPVFSPDGRYIAMVTNVQGGHDIYRMQADGSGRIRLTQTPLWVPVQPDSNGQQWNNVSPAWSPDGSQLAFLTDRTGRWEIWVMNVDGSNPQPMFSEEITGQLQLSYDFVDERVLSWR